MSLRLFPYPLTYLVMLTRKWLNWIFISKISHDELLKALKIFSRVLIGSHVVHANYLSAIPYHKYFTTVSQHICVNPSLHSHKKKVQIQKKTPNYQTCTKTETASS